MREPTPQELERLKEIALNSGYGCNCSKCVDTLLTVWREATEGRSINDFICIHHNDAERINIGCPICEHNTRIQLELAIKAELDGNRTLSMEMGQQKPTETFRTFCKRIAYEKEQLEASLKLAVGIIQRADKVRLGCRLGLDVTINPWEWGDALSTIRANHPALFPEEKK